jgi:hypothetical protein
MAGNDVGFWQRGVGAGHEISFGDNDVTASIEVKS